MLTALVRSAEHHVLVSAFVAMNFLFVEPKLRLVLRFLDVARCMDEIPH